MLWRVGVKRDQEKNVPILFTIIELLCIPSALSGRRRRRRRRKRDLQCRARLGGGGAGNMLLVLLYMYTHRKLVKRNRSGSSRETE